VPPAARITPRLALAYHESGHALVALCAGLTVDEINVTDRDGGKCFYERGSPAGDTVQRVEWAAREMRILYAAREAERWISPHEMFRRGRDDRGDLEQLVTAVTILTGDENYAQELADVAQREAARLIDRMFPLVKKLAKAVSSRGRLTGDEIWEILGGKPGARSPNKEPAKQRAPQKTPEPAFWARTDGYFVLPRTPERMIAPDARACELVTRAFRRRHSGRD
jgi:hypothetical protein